jgi:hypothetical protein
MRRVRASAASAAWIAIVLLLAACASEVATAPGAAPPTPQPASVRRAEPATRQQVRAEIFRWFTAAGYKEFQTVALMEHARYESGYRPCAAGPGGYRYTFQWGGRRLQRLHEFAGTRRCPPLDRQLAFADDELRNDPKFSCFLRTTTKASALAALRRGFGAGSC